jgi:hypothetical protein
MKKLFVLGVSALLVSVVANADMYWQSNGAQPSVAPGTASTDPAVGDFLQLIYCPSGTPELYYSGNATGVMGTSGHDQIYATGFFGQDEDINGDGYFAAHLAVTGVGPGNGSVFYVRGYDAPTANFAAGLSAPVPTGAKLYQSGETFSYTHSDTLPSYYFFTLNAVPEPTVVTLFFGGLSGLYMLRRKLK